MKLPTNMSQYNEPNESFSIKSTNQDLTEQIDGLKRIQLCLQQENQIISEHNESMIISIQILNAQNKFLLNKTNSSKYQEVHDKNQSVRKKKILLEMMNKSLDTMNNELTIHNKLLKEIYESIQKKECYRHKHDTKKPKYEKPKECENINRIQHTRHVIRKRSYYDQPKNTRRVKSRTH